ncbi:MAG: DNA polymerase III subunit alpha [Brachymonas sp.]|nr:DNA polymerase III subunit alpha [Brachymonas sp.]
MFVHLRLHSEFSVVDGTVRIDEAVAAAAQHQQPALALTDLNNLFGAVKFYRAAHKAGVQPIIGAEVLVEDLLPPAKDRALPRLLLLAQNQQGYLNLCELLTRGWLAVENKPQATIPWRWLQELGEGLIVLSGAQAGPLGAALLAGDQAQAHEVALQCVAAFPNRFYLELQRAGRSSDEPYIAAAMALAQRMQLPVVATHPVQFLEAEGFEAHEARICIAEGEILGNQRRPRRFTHQQYFHSSEQMQALFADIPSALANTVEIARRCHLTLDLGKPQLPHYPTPDGLSIEDYFRQLSLEGLEQRLAQLYPDSQQREQERPRYLERLEFEIATIVKMGFPGYFLVVADFINWAKNHGCPVGPGRGSGAGSLVAYALKITDLDPLAYGLLFERFLNPERVSMPDFDIDFCQANRDRVIEYVKGKYGKEAVSQIVTFGTMAARAAIRDVGRVLDLSYNFCDGISKLVPNKPGKPVTLQYPPANLTEEEKEKYAIAAEPQLAERIANDDEVKMLIELAQQLEGLTRNIGMHAGGVLIAPNKLTDFCPLYQQPGSEAAVSQFDKDDVEAAGLVKFDFLGLATLTIMELARDLIRARHKGQENFSFDDIPLDDKPTFKLFQNGQTEAVFQFESGGMQRMLCEALPTRFEDLIALNAMYRPGPMENIPSFVARKHGREEVSYPHPLLEGILGETYGVMVYQEQVMLAAQIVGGYTLGGADLLRRAMGKKKPEEMAQHRGLFAAGAAEKGISAQQASDIFDLMEKFAGYGFNKSHAAAYSLLAYQTAWLKVHYTAEFFCANMTVELDNTDKLKVLAEDARAMGMQFELPDINRSGYRFEPVSNQVIRYGLGAIKGTGENAIDAIIQARNEGGAFSSLFDFCNRVDRSKLNKRTVEALVKAGAFDSIHRNRAALLASIDLAFDYALAQEANANQGGLFDMADDGHGSSTQEPDLVATTPWDIKERLLQEKTAVGFFLSGHLFDACAEEVRRFVRTPLAELEDSREPQLLAGIVSDLRFINGNRGRLALFRLEDGSAVYEASCDEAVFAGSTLLKEDALLIAQCRVQFDRFSSALRVNVLHMMDLATARCRYGKYLLAHVGPLAAGDTGPAIGRIFADHPPQKETTDSGDVLVRGLTVRLNATIHGPDGDVLQGMLPLDDTHRFYPSDAALASWVALLPQGEVGVVYDAARGN